jgi:hypothetical protein
LSRRNTGSNHFREDHRRWSSNLEFKLYGKSAVYLSIGGGLRAFLKKCLIKSRLWLHCFQFISVKNSCGDGTVNAAASATITVEPLIFYQTKSHLFEFQFVPRSVGR